MTSKMHQRAAGIVIPCRRAARIERPGLGHMIQRLLRSPDVGENVGECGVARPVMRAERHGMFGPTKPVGELARDC